MNRSDVFISYRRVNKEFARTLNDALKAEGLEVWVDWEDIAPGVPDFTEEIEEGIQGADAMIPILSPAYLESPYCMGELQMAIDMHKRIVPLVFEKFDVDQLQPEVQAINWVYFTPHVGEENTFEEAFPVLMEALRADFEHLNAHTRYFLRATEWDEGNRNNSFLLYGREIDEAEAWLATAGNKNPSPLNLHTEYIFASRANQRNGQRRLLTGVIFAFILSVALAVFAIDRARQAQIAQQEAQENQQQARSLLWSNYAVQAVADSDTRLALPLALAANTIDGIVPPPFSQQALAAAAYAPGPRSVYNEQGRVWAVAYSPDEQFIATGNSNGELALWQANNSDSPLWRIQAHEGSVWDLEYMVQGDRIITAGADGAMVVWDVETQREVQRFQAAENDSLWSIAVDVNPSREGSSGRELVAAGGVLGDIYLWDIAEGELVIDPLPTGNDSVWKVEFSPQGRYLAAGGSNGVVSLWEGVDFNSQRTFPHGAEVWAIAFRPESTQEGVSLFVGGAGDNRIVRYSIADLASSQTFRGHGDRVLDIEFSSNGASFLSGDASGSIILWDTSSSANIRSYAGHTDSVWDIARARRELQFLSASADGSVIRWDIEGGAERYPAIAAVNPVTSVTFSHDGSRIYYGTEDRDIVGKELEGSGEIRFGREHVGAINSLALHPDPQKNIMLSAGGRFILVWDAAFGGQRDVPTMEHQDIVRVVKFDPKAGSPYIYSAGSDNHILRWNSETYLPDGVPFEMRHQATIWDIAVNPVTNQIASASSDRTVIIWDTDTGKPIATEFEGEDGTQIDESLGVKDYHNGIVRAVAFSPDGNLLASGGDDRAIILLDMRTDEVIGSFSGHNAPIYSIDFSKDGANIVSSDEDGLLIIWDLDGNPLRRYAQRDAVTQVSFHPEGEPEVVSSSLDGTIVIWRADNLDELVRWTNENRAIRQLTANECQEFQVVGSRCEVVAGDADAPPPPVTETDPQTGTEEPAAQASNTQ